MVAFRPFAADGSLHDACLLAAVAALSTIRLPAVAMDAAGNVAPASAAVDGSNSAALPEPRPLQLGCLPVSLTCGIYQDRLLVDPTAGKHVFPPPAICLAKDSICAGLGLLTSLFPLGCCLQRRKLSWIVPS